jgi:hypothetical protein
MFFLLAVAWPEGAALNGFGFILQSEARGAENPEPADEAEDVSPDVVLGWLPGASAATHDVYLGTNFDDVDNADTSSAEYKTTLSADTNTYDPEGYLAFATTYYWRIDDISGVVAPGYWKGPVWSFTTAGGKAADPSPPYGAEEVPRDVRLSWAAGAIATSHDVYFGTSLAGVTNATTSSDEYKTNLPAGTTTYDLPGFLDYGRTYYWRIDAKNPVEKKKGDVWRFMVRNFIVLDDMEAYDNDGNPIHETWSSGVDNSTGSEVWLALKTSEPVYSGDKSMGYSYDNNAPGADSNYSEAGRLVDDPRDWTEFAANVLSLWFYGDPHNDASDSERMYVGLDDKSGTASFADVGYGDQGEDPNDIKDGEWQQWAIDLQLFGDAGVNLGDVNAIYIGFGHPDAQEAGGAGTVYFDDIRLYRPAVYPDCWDYLTQCHGDSDNSGDVNAPDFQALKDSNGMAYPNDPEYNPCADFDRNGKVNGTDMLILKNNWYQTVDANCPQGDINRIYQSGPEPGPPPGPEPEPGPQPGRPVVSTRRPLVSTRKPLVSTRKPLVSTRRPLVSTRRPLTPDSNSP